MDKAKKTSKRIYKKGFVSASIPSRMIIRIKADSSEYRLVKTLLLSIFKLYSKNLAILLIEDNFSSEKLEAFKKFLNNHGLHAHKLLKQATAKNNKVYLIDPKSQIQVENNIIKVTSHEIFPRKISTIHIKDNKISFRSSLYTFAEEQKFKLAELTKCIKKINNKHEDKIAKKSTSAKSQISTYILENLLDATNLIIVGIGHRGHIQIFNKAAEKVSGFSRQEIIGKNWFDYVIPKDVYKFYDAQSKEASDIKNFESSIVTKTGDEKVIHWQINDVQFGGNLIGTIAMGMDISQLIGYVNQLNEGQEKYKALEENNLIGIVRRSPYGNYLSANKTFSEITGYTRKEIRSMSLDLLTYQEDLDKELMLNDQLLKEKIPSYRIEKRLLRKSGELVWVEVSAAPFKNLSGEIEYLIVIIQNIDKRKKAEFALKESEVRFKLITQNPTVGIAWADERGYVLEYNKAFQEMFGYSQNELLGISFQQITHPEDVKKEQALIEKIVKGKISNYQIEKRYINKNGEIFWVDLNLNCVRNDKNEIQYFIGIIQNIDARKKAEAALKHSEEQYRFLANTVPQIFWTADKNGYVDYFNIKWREFTGLTNEESINSGWVAALYPDDISATEKEWNDAVRRGVQYEKELRLVNSEGKYKWFLSRATPLKNDKGEITKWFGTCVDIHDLKIALQNLDDAYKELKHVNVDLDNFIYTASHDLKAPISNIEGLVNFLSQAIQDAHPDSEKVEEIDGIVKMILQSIEKFRTTIEDLTDVTKVQSQSRSSDLKKISLYDALEEAKVTLMNDINNSKCIIRHDFEEAPELRFSMKDLRSILYNLLSNAIKYRARERTCKIYLKSRYKDNSMVLEIKDNGIGIDPKNKENIFHIFSRVHTKKLEIEGTGVGLYILKRIMENNNGSIEVKSEVGVGSTFKLIFPDQKK